MSQPDESEDDSQDERPLSYVSHDSQWQEIEDAERARKLEEALAALETGGAIPMVSPR